jgi:translation initiation factor IF-3
MATAPESLPGAFYFKLFSYICNIYIKTNMNNNSRGRVGAPVQEHKTNNMIRCIEVRLTGDDPRTGEAFKGDVVRTEVAQGIAASLGLDLIMINENAAPPVVRIGDYKKFLYDNKKKKKELEQKSKKTETKELRMGPNIGDHDLSFKIKNAEEWLKSGMRIKAVIFFKGRNIVHKDRGEFILLKFAEALAELGAAEHMPKMEGKRMYMTIKSRSKNS